MKYYKNTQGDVYAYDQEQIDGGWVKEGLVPMTAAEVEAHLNPPLVPPTLEHIQELRRRAYVAESDPLKNEADYDALVNGTAPDYTAWMAAVEAIKTRYPLP